MSWASRHNLLARAVNRNLGGVSVIAGAVSGVGLLDRNAELINDGNVISIEYQLTLLTAQFGNLQYGDGITVDGEVYAVRQAPMVIGDGIECIVLLEKLAPGVTAPGGQPRRFGLADLYDVDDNIQDSGLGTVIQYDGTKWKGSVIEGEGYVFTQSTPAATWVINHNLGFKPSVELMNTGSQEIDGDVIHTSVNQTIVNFTSPVAGLARLT